MTTMRESLEDFVKERQERQRQESQQKRKARLSRQEAERNRTAEQNKQRRWKTAQESQTRLLSYTKEANRLLVKAIDETKRIRLPRQSPEGRQYQRLVRCVEAAIRSLQQIDRTGFRNRPVDLDLDL